MSIDPDRDLRATLRSSLPTDPVDPALVERIVAASRRRGGRRWVWEVTGIVALAVAIAGVLAVGLFRSHPAQPAVSAVTHTPAPSTSAIDLPAGAAPTPSPAPCDPDAPAVPPSWLTVPRNVGDIHLEPVQPSVQPKVSAAAATATMTYMWGSQPKCGLPEVLAYLSASYPATIRPECFPPSNSSSSPWASPASCANGNDTTPNYTHILAWAFTWRSDCGLGTGPPAAPNATPRALPTPQPLSCGAFTFVDATTGSQGFSESAGAASVGL